MDRIVIGPDALGGLAALVADIRSPGPIAVVVDRQPMRRAGADLKSGVVELLRAVEPDVRLVALGRAGEELHADAGAIEAAIAGARGSGVVVAVGSGTICDIAKEASRELGVPEVVVQTANSVNAFSDDMAVLLIHGVKRTVPSHWPAALVIDLTTLADAPAALNRSGVGELVAMFTGPADWRLAGAFAMDPTWDRRVVDLFRDGADALIAAAPGATSADHAAQRTLAELMTLSGLALGIAGRTAPISGTEHTVSHLLDMAAARSGTRTGLHGAQVGVAALAVSIAWERLLGDFDPQRLVEAPARDERAMQGRIAEAFRSLDPTGTMAEECWTAYRRKLVRWEAGRAELAAIVRDWDALRADLGTLLGRPVDIAGILRAAGAPATFEELDPPATAATATWALFNGHLMRDRFTIADLAWFGGAWTEDLAAEAIADAAALAASITVGTSASATSGAG